MITLYASPYDFSANGFYFSSVEDYDTKYKDNRNDYGQHVEEYEIQYIDGSDASCDFANIYTPDQCNLNLWLEQLALFEQMAETEQIALKYLITNNHCSIGEAFEKYLDVEIIKSSLIDYAFDLVDDMGILDKLGSFRHYFDFEAFARDLDISGDVEELKHGWLVVNAGNI